MYVKYDITIKIPKSLHFKLFSMTDLEVSNNGESEFVIQMEHCKSYD